VRQRLITNVTGAQFHYDSLLTAAGHVLERNKHPGRPHLERRVRPFLECFLHLSRPESSFGPLVTFLFLKLFLLNIDPRVRHLVVHAVGRGLVFLSVM